MSGINDACQVFVPLLYFAAWFAYWTRSRSAGLLPVRLPTILLSTALLVQAAHLVVRARMIHQLPWTTYHDTLAALGFLMTFTYLVVELTTRVGGTGVDLLPYPLAMVTWSAAFGPHEPRPDPLLDNELFIMHTVPAIGGVAAILVSGVFGLLYLRLERAMRAKRFEGIFQRLPDLQVLARMNFFAAVIGLILVTAAIGWGATWYGDLFEKVNVFEAKIFLTLCVWAVLLLPVFGRLLRRWPDRATAVVSVATASLALLSILMPLLPMVNFHGHG